MKKPLTIRLDEDVRQAADRLAKIEGRSLSGLIQKMLRDEAIRRGAFVATPLRAVAKAKNNT